MNQMWPIILGAVAIYSIFMGARILFTGRLTEREEAQLKGFSNKGARTYKLAYAIISIVGGLLVAAVAVVRLLENFKVLGDTFVLRMVILGVAIVVGLSMIFIRNACKKMTDDE